MKPTVDTEALKTTLEAALGDKIVSMDLIQVCSRPENFAIRTAGNKRYAVKCCGVTLESQERFEAMLAHHRELEAAGSKAVRLVCPPVEFQGGIRLLIMEWCPGLEVMPHKLTNSQMKNLIPSLLSFANSLQQTTHILPFRPTWFFKNLVSEYLSDKTYNRLFESVSKWLGDEYLSYREDELKIIHGDLHHGNLFWQYDDISGFMDLEEFRYGYTTDDWIRYIVCAAEHTLWYDYRAKRRILDLYRTMIHCFPAYQWHTSINGLLMRKAASRTIKTSIKTWYYLNLKFRLGFYRKLHSMVDEFYL